MQLSLFSSHPCASKRVGTHPHGCVEAFTLRMRGMRPRCKHSTSEYLRRHGRTNGVVDPPNPTPRGRRGGTWIRLGAIYGYIASRAWVWTRMRTLEACLYDLTAACLYEYCLCNLCDGHSYPCGNFYGDKLNDGATSLAITQHWFNTAGGCLHLHKQRLVIDHLRRLGACVPPANAQEVASVGKAARPIQTSPPGLPQGHLMHAVRCSITPPTSSALWTNLVQRPGQIDGSTLILMINKSPSNSSCFDV